MIDAASLYDPMRRRVPAERLRAVHEDAVRSLLMDQATSRLDEHRLAQVNRLLVDLYEQSPGDRGQAGSVAYPD